MEPIEILNSIQKEFSNLKLFLSSQRSNSNVSDKWLSRSHVMSFLSYAPTQMAALEKSGELVVSKVGRRKFILRSSLEEYLERNIQKKG